MARFPDCESCAFYHVEEAICDECNDADQWEPDDPGALMQEKGERKLPRIRIHKDWKIAA